VGVGECDACQGLQEDHIDLPFALAGMRLTIRELCELTDRHQSRH
jgi:hypothetical protein